MPLWLLAATIALAGRKTNPVEPVDPFSPAQLEAMTQEIVPAIERAAGRPFLTPPVVALATPDVFAKMLADEARLIGSMVQRDTPTEIRERREAENAHAMGGGLLGKYGLFEDKLFLCRDAIEGARAESGLPETQVVAIAKVILAHELVHALHDQHSDLERIVRGLADQDALWAASGTWEGLATWASERAAAELGLTDTWTWLAGLQGWSPDGGLQQEGAYATWALYGAGRDAMAVHFERGGFDRVWQVATTPPERSSGLFRPVSWPATRVPPPLDYVQVLSGTQQQLTSTEWVIGISMLGEFDLRGEAVFGDNAAALDEVLDHLQQGWRLDAEGKDRRGDIRILEFDEPVFPARYLEILRQQQGAQAVHLASLIGREVEIRYEPFTQVPSDAATLRSSKIAGVGGVSTERHEAWVVRGDTVVVVASQGFRPGLRTGWTVDEVFRRLEAARAGLPMPEPLPH